MTLRAKLLLLSLSVLALPWAGWKFVQQLEVLLRQGQEQALLAQLAGKRLMELAEELRAG